MVNEEDYLKQKMGQKTPFSVPEGYFDRLAERVMQQLPEEKTQTTAKIQPLSKEDKKPTVIKRLRPWLYAAVCAGVVALSATLFLKNSPTAKNNQQYAMAKQTEVTPDPMMTEFSDTYIEDATNYAMIDNEEIYAYLADL